MLAHVTRCHWRGWCRQGHERYRRDSTLGQVDQDSCRPSYRPAAGGRHGAAWGVGAAHRNRRMCRPTGRAGYIQPKCLRAAAGRSSWSPHTGDRSSGVAANWVPEPSRRDHPIEHRRPFGRRHPIEQRHLFGGWCRGRCLAQDRGRLARSTWSLRSGPVRSVRIAAWAPCRDRGQDTHPSRLGHREHQDNPAQDRDAA